MVNIGLIGCGYWGPNLLRSFNSISDCRVQKVAELDAARLAYIQQNYPTVSITKNYKDLLGSKIDAVVIATPARTHFQFAKEAIQNKKHVLIEKPMAMTVKEAKELMALAQKNRCKIMVGHTFEYNAAVRSLKKYIQNGTIGQPYYLYAQRLNFGIVRSDINALWNLAPHDISILLYLLEKMPLAVSARGDDFIQKGIEDVVFVVLYFPGDIMAHIHVSWLDPNKTRKLTVVGSEKMIVYDDVSDAKIQIYDKGIKKKNIKDSLGEYDDFAKFQTAKVAGDKTIPKIDFIEPLKTECAHFIDCILNDKTPLTDGLNGLRVVRVLEAAQESMKRNGQLINVK
ncbi:MAG: Gfo/Idh/MocA family oxidoreductase [Candidatus Omnitrophota bacterium]